MAPAPAVEAEAPAPAPRQKRSRWGAGKSEAPAAADTPAAEAPKKRSRWGAKPAEATDPIQLAVQLGLPLATLQHMSSEQQASLPKLKEKVTPPPSARPLPGGEAVNRFRLFPPP